MTADRTAALEAALLPCPFCGDSAQIGSFPPTIECTNCGAETGHYKTNADAAAAWNLRAGSDVSGDRMREALEPSGETKAAYSGEFKFKSQSGRVEYVVPWTTVKEIMAAIRARAALLPSKETKT